MSAPLHASSSIDSSGSRHSLIALDALHLELSGREWRVAGAVQVTLAALVVAGGALLLVVVAGAVQRVNPPLQALASLCVAYLLAAWAAAIAHLPPTSCQLEMHTALLLGAHNACALSLLAYTLSYYLAVFRPLQYSALLTPRRCWVALAAAWVLALLVAHTHFLIALIEPPPQRETLLFCVHAARHTHIVLAICVGLAALLALVSSFALTRALLFLRPLAAFTSLDPARPHTEPPRRSTRELHTVLLGLALYALGWLPYLVVCYAHAQQHNTAAGREEALALQACIALMLASCLASVLLYSLRLETVTNGYAKLLDTVRQWCRATRVKVARKLRRKQRQGAAPLNNAVETF